MVRSCAQGCQTQEGESASSSLQLLLWPEFVRKPQMSVDLLGNCGPVLLVLSSLLFLCSQLVLILQNVRCFLCTAYEQHYSLISPRCEFQGSQVDRVQFLSSVPQGTLAHWLCCGCRMPQRTLHLTCSAQCARLLRCVGKMLLGEHVLSGGSLGTSFFKLMFTCLPPVSPFLSTVVS